MTSVLNLDDIHKRAGEIEREKMLKAMEALKKQQGHEEELHQSFMHDDLNPRWREQLNRAIMNAVENDKNELMVMRFPSAWCSDKGRAINNCEPDWPHTLSGKSARAYAAFEEELRPLGYRLKAQILSFPGGMPGDVGIYLHW
ncbi:MAG: hypothetical protein R3D03_23230 [Geminicoccaceae bacterium]|nr:hypothetical protein [Geminicoccaceae bacterium]